MPARACRGCLATGPRLYNIYKNNLYEEFAEVVGNPISESDDLPQHMCGICFAQLSKYILFRNRCRLAQDILADLKLQGMKLSTRFIKQIDRSKCNLDTNLNVVTPLSCDLIIQEEIADEPLSESHDELVYDHEVEPLPPETSDEEDGQENVLNETDPSHWFTSAESPGEEKPLHDDEVQENITLSPTSKTEPDCCTPVDSPEVTESLTKESLKSIKSTESKRVNKNRYDYLGMIEEFKTKYNMDVEFLTKEEQINEVREKIRKSSTRLGAGPFCSYCGKSCISDAYLEKHFNECHDESAGTDECDICRYRLPSQQLQKHILTHQVRILCQLCDFTTKNFGAALYHARQHGDNGAPLAYLCTYCEVVFEKRELLNSHLLRDHFNKLPWCKFCGKTVLNKSGMRYHVKYHEDLLKSDYRCPYCRLNLVTIEALEKHLSLTCEEYNCVMCGDHFESKMLLKEHLIQQHPRLKHINLAHCDGCGVKFFGTEPLEKHLGENTCGSGHPCQTCGDTFLTEQTLEDHNLESHLKPYQACEICDKAFDAKNYRQHILTVHNSKQEPVHRGADHTSPNLWSVEDSGASEPTSEEKEKRTLICDVCGKTFLRYVNLKIHMRSHTGERPFCCDICSKGFTRKEALKEHMLIHSDDRTHKCEECHKAFRRRDALNRHMLCHGGIRRHICRVCGMKFHTSTDAMAHIKSVHLKAPKPRQQVEQGHTDTQDDMDRDDVVYIDNETHTQDHIHNDTQNHKNNEVNAQNTENEGYTQYYMDSEIETQDYMDHEVETNQVSMDNEIQIQDSMDNEVQTQDVLDNKPHSVIKIIPFNRLGKQKMIRVEGTDSDHAQNYVDIQTQYYRNSGLTQNGAIHVHHENFNTATAVPRITKTIHIKRRKRLVSNIPKQDSDDITQTQGYMDADKQVYINSDTLTQVIDNNENTQNYIVSDANTHIYMENDENIYSHIDSETQKQDFIAKETNSAVVVLPVNQPMKEHLENIDTQDYMDNNIIQDNVVHDYDGHSSSVNVTAVPRITKTIHIRRRKKQMDSDIPTQQDENIHTQDSMDTQTQDLVSDETASLVHNLDDHTAPVVPRITKTIHMRHRKKRMVSKK